MNWKQLENSKTLGACMDNSGQNNFTFIRLIAALLVVLSHCYWIVDNAPDPIYFFTKGTLMASHIGLAGFFFLSGLLVSQSLHKSPSTRNFLWKRFLRVYPAAIFAVVVCAFIIGPFLTTYPLKEYFASPVFYQYLATCFLIRVYYHLPGVFEHSVMADSVNASLWSLSLEIKLYVGLLLSKFLKKHIKIILLMLLIIASVICNAFYFTETEQLLERLVGRHVVLYPYTMYAAYFLTGVLCYDFKDSIKISVLWLPFLVVLFLAIVYKQDHSIAMLIFMPCFILYVSVCGTKLVRKITPRADLSYGIYVFAYPVQQIVCNYLHPGKSIWLFVLTVVCTIPLALISWYGIESKALKLKNLLQ